MQKNTIPPLTTLLVASSLVSHLHGQAGSDDSWFLGYGNAGSEHIVMEPVGEYLYIGGLLGSNTPNLQRFNLATEAFEAIPGIPNGQVGYRAIFYDKDDQLLYVGGNGKILPADGTVGVFDLKTETWSTLRDPTLPVGQQTGGNAETGVNQGFIRAIVKHDNKIYLGGSLLGTGVTDGASIRRFDLSTEKWETAGDGLNRLGTVWDLKVSPSGELYAAGGFTSNGDETRPLASLAVLSSNDEWVDVGGGVDNVIRQIEFAPEGIYCGGDFAVAGVGQGAIACDDVALYRTNGTWASLNSQNFSSNFSANQDGIFSMNLSSEGDLYMVGDFDLNVAGVRLNHVGRWDGSAWNALAGGVGRTDTQIAESSALVGDNFYVAGNFTVQGTVGRVSFARWNAKVDFSGFQPGVNDVRSVRQWTPEIIRSGNQVTVQMPGGSRNDIRYNLVESLSLSSAFQDAGVSSFGEFGKFETKLGFTVTEASAKAFYRITADPF